jgi:antitoxin VapB
MFVPNTNETASMPQSNPTPRRVQLFRNHRSQAIRIPKEFELPGTEAIISRDGNRLIIEPVRSKGLIALLDGWEPLTEEFPGIADAPPTPEDIF